MAADATHPPGRTSGIRLEGAALEVYEAAGADAR